METSINYLIEQLRLFNVMPGNGYEIKFTIRYDCPGESRHCWTKVVETSSDRIVAMSSMRLPAYSGDRQPILELIGKTLDVFESHYSPF